MAIHTVMQHARRRRRARSRREAGPGGAITLRGLPPVIAGELRRLALERGLSLNRLVVALLTDRLGSGRHHAREPAEHHDLDALAGSWTREEASAFDRALASQRRIDAEVWRKP
jgi:hypothetical protein